MSIHSRETLAYAPLSVKEIISAELPPPDARLTPFSPVRIPVSLTSRPICPLPFFGTFLSTYVREAVNYVPKSQLISISNSKVRVNKFIETGLGLPPSRAP